MPQGKTTFDLWDGDFDRNGDTDDPNTANSAIPTWSVTAAQTEGTRQGAPADDCGAAQGAYDRPPDVYYNVVLPDVSSFTNANPSGDREWELFRLGTSATSTPAPDVVVPAVPAGLWHVDMVGLDVANLCALRFDSPVLGVDASGTIVRPQYPYLLGDRVWFDTNRNGVQDSGEASLTTGPIMTLRDGAGSFIEMAAADAGGYYAFTTLPCTYTVDANDPTNYAPGGPLAGLIPTTPRVLTSVVTTTNNLALDFGFARGPALVVTKALASVLSTTAVAGEDTTYVVTVRNVGETTATSIVVTDTIVGADMAYVSGSTTATYTGGSSNADPTSPTASTLRWDFGASSKIASGGVLTLTYRVRVKAGAASGAHPDTIAAGAKDASGTAVVPDASRWIAADTDPDDSAGASVWVMARPKLDITKTRTSADTTIQAGQSATFAIVVRNTGDSRVATVPVTDTFPGANLRYASALPSPSGVGSG